MSNTPKLRLNLTNKQADSSETAAKDVAVRVKQASAKKKAANETLDEAWQRILAMSLTEKEMRYVQLAKQSNDSEVIGRLSESKLTKDKVIAEGRQIEARQESKLRQQRIQETLANKPANYHILTQDSQLADFLGRLRQEVRLQREQWADRFEALGVESMTAGDFEGTGIDAYIDLSIGFSIWLPLLDEGYYLAYGHVDVRGTDLVPENLEPYAFKDGDSQLTRSKVLEAITPYLSLPSHGKTFHMGAARYDLHIAQNDGYRIRGCVWDTLDAMRTLTEHLPSYGLKPITQRYAKQLGIEGEVYTFEDLFGKASPAPFNTEIVGIYAINDVKYGWKVFEFQFEAMKRTDNLFTCYSQVDKDLPETDVFLERCGFRIDLNHMRQLEREFEPKVEEAKKRVYETYEIDAEFIRKMDRTINAGKIKKWITAQKNRIQKAKDKIAKKEAKLTELEAANKTHLKSYQNERDMLAKYQRELADLKSPIEQNAPQEITEFTMTNGNHLAYLIYDHLEIEDKTYKVTRDKKRSTAAEVLDMYYEDEPSLEPLATVAEYTKLLSTYIRPVLGTNEEGESVLEIDGRLHSNFKAGGTKTGRYSSSGYNGRPADILADL
jgi:DNA polymerase I